MSIRTIFASVCASVKLAFLVHRTWTWKCINIPNYNNNICMYHLTDPTHAWSLGGVCIVYIGSAADRVLDIVNHFNVSYRVIQQG